MATLEQLSTALRNADAAGDVDAARQLAAAIKQMQGPSVMEPPSLMDRVTGAAKAAGSGVAQGLEGVVGLPADAINLANAGINKLTGANPPPMPHGPLPTSEDINQALPQLDYKPQTAFERYLKSGTAGAAGMVAGGGTRAPLYALGAFAGLGGQAGEDLGGPYGRAFGTAAGLAPGLISLRTPQSVKALKGFLQETPEAELLTAQAVRNQAEKALGTPVLLNQGMADPTALSAIAGEVARSPSGQILNRVLTRQLPVGQEKIDQLIASTQGLEPSKDAANQILDAGKKAMAAPREARTSATREMYDAARAETIPPEQVDALAAGVRNVGERMNLSPASDAGRGVNRAAGQIKATQPPETPPGLIVDEKGNPLIPAKQPPTSVLKLNSVAREKARGPSPLNPTSKEINQQEANKAVAAAIKDTIAPEGSALKSANDLYSTLSQELVAPMERSALGDMFPAAGRTNELVGGKYSSYSKIFDPTKYGPKDIEFAAANLNMADPQAWPSIVKRHFITQLKKVSKPVEGRAPEGALGDFSTAIRGEGTQARKSFDETMRGVANANGEDPAAVVSGANKLLDALQVVARDRGVVGQVNVGEFERLAGGNVVSGVTRGLNFIQPFRAVGRVLERHVRARTYSQIADALTSPDGVKKLIEISRYSPTDARLTAAVRALTTGAAVEEAGH